MTIEAIMFFMLLGIYVVLSFLVGMDRKRTKGKAND